MNTKWTELFDALQPLLVCHAFPGLLGGLIRWLYLLRAGQYKGRHPRLKMLYDILGGLLVGTVLGPALGSFTTVPSQQFSLFDVLRTLPSWLAARWFISAVTGFFWLAALDASKEKITSLVREWFQRSGKKGGNDAPKNTPPRRPHKPKSRRGRSV